MVFILHKVYAFPILCIFIILWLVRWTQRIFAHEFIPFTTFVSFLYFNLVSASLNATWCSIKCIHNALNIRSSKFVLLGWYCVGGLFIGLLFGIQELSNEEINVSKTCSTLLFFWKSSINKNQDISDIIKTF